MPKVKVGIYQQFNIGGDIGFVAAMGNVLMLLALVELACSSWSPAGPDGVTGE